MPHHHERRELPFSAAQMYDLVVDVSRYPEFLPWVSAIRITSNNETEIIADMVVGFKSIKERFSSRVLKMHNQKIEVEYLDGPMKSLTNIWYFEVVSDTDCAIEFTVDFEFRNPLLQMLAGQFFERALLKMTDAFIKRAEVLYGHSSEPR